MEIRTADANDLDTVFSLYDAAIEFQKTVFDKHWLGFDRNLVSTELAERRLWKLIESEEVACIWSVAYADPMIWGEDSSDRAMYIHRIVTNPDFRGRGYVRTITEWAKGHARENGLRFVRMDTWGDNEKLIDYYQDCGFRLVGIVTPAESASLPRHYSAITLSLFEIELNDDPKAL